MPYSFDIQDTVFVNTSFPNKITSYSKRGLPTIFHGPSYSDVYNFVINNEIGFSINSIYPPINFLDKITHSSISKNHVGHNRSRRNAIDINKVNSILNLDNILILSYRYWDEFIKKNSNICQMEIIY